MKRTILSTVLILGGMLNAARGDTWVFRDTLRPNGHDRSMAAKRIDGRKCGSTRQNVFSDGDAFVRCMQTYGWALDHIVSDQSARYIDPDSGMSCQNIGGVAVCDPPQGTVKYYDPDQGLNCTRTGLVSICSNF
jgi:hypothetical protein